MVAFNSKTRLPEPDQTIAELKQRLEQVERERDQFQQRTEKAERERDQAQQRAEKAEADNQRLRELLQAKAKSKSAKTPQFTENYSLDRNVKRKVKKKKKPRNSSGRRPKQHKLQQVSREQNIYPEGVDPCCCEYKRTQFA